MKNLIRFSAIVLILFTAIGCASTNKNLKEFNNTQHGSAAEEFAPHKNVTEWWYATGYLKDAEANLYFYQFTIFHGFIGNMEGYSLHLGFTDIKSGKHSFEESINFRSWNKYANEFKAVYRGSSITMKGSEMQIVADGKDLKMDIKLNATKNAVWHGKDGIIIMGHPDKPQETSFYYSYTDMKTSGLISFKNEQNSWTEAKVTGQSWFDRQWGTFTETKWDWFSIRLFDGTELMLFSFPDTGYKDATIAKEDGTSYTSADFSYQVTDTILSEDLEFATAWDFSLNFLNKKIKIQALNKTDINPNITGPDYWEGLCEVYDETGELIGYCVTETTY